MHLLPILSSQQVVMDFNLSLYQTFDPLDGFFSTIANVPSAEDTSAIISGERTKEKEEQNDRWHRMERSSGKFVRRFRLPENAKMDEVKASMENGVLTVTVPKEEVKKPEVKAIQVSGE
uniref:SHSP domain-containing protein n=1 Tax=Chenopodium quinoa TaxID=63459 RepID=A0A803LCJ8_CHEQI